MRAAVLCAVPADQQAQVDEWLAQRMHGRRAVIAENAFAPLEVPPDVTLARLAPGCVCCVGQVPLRVTVTRVVRTHRPDDLLLLLATPHHVSRVRALLADGSLGVRFEVE